MRSPLLRLAAGLLLLTACAKKKNGPTYNTGMRDVAPPSATALHVASAAAPIPGQSGG
jgi:hypothetical protein